MDVTTAWPLALNTSAKWLHAALAGRFTPHFRFRDVNRSWDTSSMLSLPESGEAAAGGLPDEAIRHGLRVKYKHAVYPRKWFNDLPALVEYVRLLQRDATMIMVAYKHGLRASRSLRSGMGFDRLRASGDARPSTEKRQKPSAPDPRRRIAGTTGCKSCRSSRPVIPIISPQQTRKFHVRF